MLEIDDISLLYPAAERTVTLLLKQKEDGVSLHVEDAKAFCDEFATLTIVADLESKNIPPTAYVYYSDPDWESDEDRWFQYPGKFVDDPENATKFADPNALDSKKWRDPNRGELVCYSLVDAIQFNRYGR